MLLPLALLGGTLLGSPPLSPAHAVPAIADTVPIGVVAATRSSPPLDPLALTLPLAALEIAPTPGPSMLRPAERTVQAGALLGPRRADEPSPDPQIIEYSDGYFTRLTIHRYSSYLMLPLFVADVIVGQKLINGDGSESLRGVHGALGAGIGVLFAVNTVTGGLNTIEAWHDPEGRTRRMIHSALMFLADVGFVATAALANENEDEGGQATPVSNTTHRNVALASMGTAVLGYTIMLPIFGSD